MIRSSWSAPRRPNHQSKFCNLKRLQSFVIPPKPFQKTIWILPKSIKICKNRFEIATKIISQAKPRSERAPKLIFTNFYQFSEALGPPKIDPKPLKSIKKRRKINVRKNYIFQHYVLSIFCRSGLPKWIPNLFFHKLFRKRRFGENPYKTLAVRRKIKVRI